MEKELSLKNRFLTRYLSLLTVLFLSSNLAAFCQDQKPPISSDRPTISASSGTVSWGITQLELGGQHQSFQISSNSLEFRSRQTNIPLLFRYGVFENLEVRLETSGMTWTNQELTDSETEVLSDSAKGFANPTIGMKWQFVETPENSYRPSVGVLLSWALPVGSEGFHPEKSELGTIVLVDFPLPRELGLTLNGGVYFRYDDFTKDCFREGLGSLAFTAPVSTSTSLFIEVAGGGPTADGGEGYAVIDGGVLHRISNGFQIDLAVLRGLTDYSTDWGFSGGLSFYLF